MNNSVSHSWITRTCSVFSTFKGYFGSSLNKLAVPGSAFLQRPHTLYCTPQHDSQTSALSSNQITFQPGSDLWSLPENLQQEGIAPSCDGLMHLYLRGWVKRPWWHWWCKLFFGNFQEEQRPKWLTFTLSTAPSKDCAQQTDLPNVLHSVAQLIRPFAWTDLMWIQRTQLWAKLFSAASF